MASRHKGQTEEQALMANIARNRQFIAEHSSKIPDSGEISKKLRLYLADNPLKLTSAALLTGVIAAAFLRNSSRKRNHSTGKRKIISALINWLIHKTGNPPHCPENGQSDVPAPLERRIVETIRQLFK